MFLFLLPESLSLGFLGLLELIPSVLQILVFFEQIVIVKLVLLNITL